MAGAAAWHGMAADTCFAAGRLARVLLMVPAAEAWAALELRAVKEDIVTDGVFD